MKVGEANADETKTNSARPSSAEKGFQDWIKSIFNGGGFGDRFGAHGFFHIVVTNSEGESAGGELVFAETPTESINHRAHDREGKVFVDGIGRKSFLFSD